MPVHQRNDCKNYLSIFEEKKANKLLQIYSLGILCRLAWESSLDAMLEEKRAEFGELINATEQKLPHLSTINKQLYFCYNKLNQQMNRFMHVDYHTVIYDHVSFDRNPMERFEEMHQSVMNIAKKLMATASKFYQGCFVMGEAAKEFDLEGKKLTKTAIIEKFSALHETFSAFAQADKERYPLLDVEINAYKNELDSYASKLKDVLSRQRQREEIKAKRAAPKKSQSIFDLLNFKARKASAYHKSWEDRLLSQESDDLKEIENLQSHIKELKQTIGDIFSESVTERIVEFRHNRTLESATALLRELIRQFGAEEGCQALDRIEGNTLLLFYQAQKVINPLTQIVPDYFSAMLHLSGEVLKELGAAATAEEYALLLEMVKYQTDTTYALSKVLHYTLTSKILYALPRYPMAR